MIGYDKQSKHTFEYVNRDIVYKGKQELDINLSGTKEQRLFSASIGTCGNFQKNATIFIDNLPYSCQFYNNNGIFNISLNKNSSNDPDLYIYTDIPTEEVLNQSLNTVPNYILNYGLANEALGHLFYQLIENNVVFTRRFSFFTTNSEVIQDCYSETYCKDYEEDAFGKMIISILSGWKVHNQIYNVLGKSSFFDSILMDKKPDVEFTYLIPLEYINEFFPNMPIKYRYVTNQIPFEVDNSKEFKVVTGDNREKIRVQFIACGHDIKEVRSFCNFLYRLSGKKYLYSIESKYASLYNKLAVFRYDKVYKKEKS